MREKLLMTITIDATAPVKTIPLRFSQENWFEIYYRLGFRWNKFDREMGCPDTLTVGKRHIKRGDVLVFQGMDLIHVY